MNFLTRAEIEACRNIGRDEVNNRSCIGLAELDALCNTALSAHDLRDLDIAVRKVVGREPLP